MKAIKNILVPTDFSDGAAKALEYAFWYAKDFEAKVTVVHVVFPGTGELDVPVISAAETQKRVQTANEALELFVESAKKNAGAGHVGTGQKVLVGAPVSELSSMIKSGSADMIVVGTRAKHNTIERIFGSVATGIIRRAAVPVIVIPEQASGPRLNTICYATDLDESDPFFIWKTRELFSEFNPLVHIVHVARDKSEYGEITYEDLREFMQARTSVGPMAFHSISGNNVVEELHKFADQHEIDLIVLRTTRRNILQRLMHESVSYKMSLHSHVPLCILKGESE